MADEPRKAYIVTQRQKVDHDFLVYADNADDAAAALDRGEGDDLDIRAEDARSPLAGRGPMSESSSDQRKTTERVEALLRERLDYWLPGGEGLRSKVLPDLAREIVGVWTEEKHQREVAARRER